MRHDAIHPMGCACERCAPSRASQAHGARPYPAPAVDPRDLDALRKGMIAGLWVGGLLAAGKFGPSIIDWMAGQ
ncbi:hypothetical protein [Sphingomonas bisphenolicum]|nr:hypothetical protein [Sphingomonas bisphenolicum]